MVCPRCKLAVKEALEKLDLHPVSISLGEVIIEEKKLSSQQEKELSNVLKTVGFEIMNDRQSKLLEQIKTLIIDTIHYKEEQTNRKFSGLISQHLHHDYSYLSKLFSEVEGITIEQYIIQQKIEKVKELLIYNELTLSQIALNMDYSSTAHLSSQFKKLTGFTPTQFKKIGVKERKPLNEVGRN
jgi:AraC-like DNA-binding protein